MSDPTLVVRVAGNLAELKANLAEGVNQIETYKSAMQRASSAFDGSRIVQQASAAAAAIQNAGGVTSLTASELAKANAIFTDAAAKMQLMGQGGTYSAQKFAELAAATKGAGEATGGWLPILRDLGNSWVARIAEGMLLRDAIREVISVVKDAATALPELILKGAGIADVEENFKRLASQVGLLGDALMGALRDGTHNTISDFELMKVASKDLSAGLNLTDQQFGTLAKGAFALAQATGVDVKTALETMNDAMLTGRGRALALLTGKIDLEAAERKYAAALGTTRDNLTEAGKLEASRSAILDAVSGATARLGEQTDGLDERVAQAATSWANFQENLGKTIATSKVIETGMDGIKRALIETFGGSQQSLIDAIAQKIDDAAIGLVSFGKVGVEVGGFLAKEWYAAEKVFGDVVQVVELLNLGAARLQLFKLKSSDLFGIDETTTAQIKEVEQAITDMTARTKERGAALQAADASQAAVDTTTAKYVATLDALLAKMADARAGTSAFIGPIQQEADAHNAAAGGANRHTEALTKEGDEILRIAELWAKAAEADLERAKSKLQLDEAAIQQRVALELAADRQRVQNGTMTEAKFQTEKSFLEYQAYQRHLELLKSEEAADIQSNGVKLDAELAKSDERYAKGLTTKAEYEAEYAAIESRYAAIRGGIQDAYFAHVDEAQQKSAAAADAAQAVIVAAYDKTNAGVMGLSASFDGWNSQVMGSGSEAFAALEGDLNSTAKSVETLAGDWITAADAKKRFDMGSSVDVTALNLHKMLDQTVTSQQFSLAGIISQYGLQGDEQKADALASQGYSFAEIVAFLEGKSPLSKTPIGPRIPGYAVGVENAPGGMAWVGERGPELMEVPRGANIYPTGTAPTSSVNLAAGAVQVTLNYPIMRDARAQAELADVVGSALLNKLYSLGFRPQSGA